MSLRVVTPSFPLSQYVECIRFIRSSVTVSSQQRVYPNGSMELVVHLQKPTMSFFDDDRLHTIEVPLLAGPYTRSFLVDPSQSSAVIGIRFRPGAARLFFPLPAHELHNTDIAFRQLYPAEADYLLNELCSAATEEAQVRVVEQYLTRKLVNATPIHSGVRYAVEQLSRAGGMRRVGKIQLEIGLSHTRFIDLFRDHVGLTPKLFCRVRRFHHLLNRIEKSMPVNWAELAADCGYYDQAHLIHDFRAFTGTTPLAFSKTIVGLDKTFLANIPS